MAARKKNRTVSNGKAALAALEGPELVFGLVGAIGTDLDSTSEILSEELRKVGYTPYVLKVSSLLYQLDEYADLRTREYKSDYERISQHMDAGSGLRDQSRRGDILALLCIAEIREIRRQHWGKKEGIRTPIQKAAYILKSLKHPSEVQTLRDVYGRAFFLVSAYSSKSIRVARLAARIANSKHDSDQNKYRHQAELLVQRDEKESGSLGQNVREAFPLADVFVAASSHTEQKAGLNRFVEILFGHPFHTPTRDEYGMFHAYGAALRSSDLGRQVGASVTTSDGDIIAVGCNEVPRAGGGLYWADDADDGRDFRRGFDSNSLYKENLLSQIVDKMAELKLLNSSATRRSAEQIRRELSKYPQLKETIAANVIEFGRAVHAEMSAISDAARRGVSITDATMYCTTFPCHLCARHLVAAGLRRVVYIEPYPKSVAAQLYPDSIDVDGDGTNDSLVLFEPFVGIAPNYYLQAFRPMLDRKSGNGRAVEWSPTKAIPKLKRFVLSYMYIEELAVGEVLPSVLSDLNLRPLNIHRK